MSSASRRPARARGERVGFDALPQRVRAWAERELGSPIAVATPQLGGMSPGPAVRVLTSAGERAFLKAVGTDLNPDTPVLMRHEAEVLSRLDAAPYRAGLRASYDDGDWVALLLDDVPGRHPDLNDEDDHALVARLVDQQSQELSPPPEGVPGLSLADNARIWAERWTRLQPLAPSWAAARFEELKQQVDALADGLPLTTLCHWDVREDNLLVRDDGTVVIVDWGMSRIGPRWADALLLALAREAATSYQDLVATHADQVDLVTATVLGLAGSQLVRSHEPSPPGLPTIRQFQRQDALALFERVRDVL